MREQDIFLENIFFTVVATGRAADRLGVGLHLEASTTALKTNMERQGGGVGRPPSRNAPSLQQL